jgi:hypothetical protein
MTFYFIFQLALNHFKWAEGIGTIFTGTTLFVFKSKQDFFLISDYTNQGHICVVLNAQLKKAAYNVQYWSVKVIFSNFSTIIKI